ncbi:MAG: glycosyltransferase family 9 protein [Dysgonamonadaceae bacterium]|jgi:heptosyltransferase-2|nr:glycosyltransferase family 9 protein [Dysgonamonadaceae bacterium]
MKKIHKILVIRFRRIGDAVVSAAICSSLKRTFPEATVDYVLNEEIAPLFDHHPDIDHLVTFSRRDMSDSVRYLKKVHRIMNVGQYDLIVDTRSTLKTLWFSFFSLGTPYRLGSKKCYNPLIHNYRVANEKQGDVVTRMLMLLQPLEKFVQVHYERFFKVYTLADERDSFARYMRSKGVDFGKPIVICVVATRLTHKMWNTERMKATVERLLNHHPEAQIILNYGDKKERSLVKQFHDALQNHPRVFSDIDAKNLRELACMAALSNFFFGIEGGIRHIAQALDIPSFAIYPPDVDMSKWLPNPGERFQGIAPGELADAKMLKRMTPQEKYDLLTVENVWERLQPMLDKFL